MHEEIIAHPSGRRLGAIGAVLLSLSLLIAVLPLGLSARAIELDGLLKEKMWLEAEPFTVIRLRDQPNCAIDEAKIFVRFDEQNRVTYIGCRFLHQKPEPTEAAEGEPAGQPPIRSGVAVQVEDTDFLVFNVQQADELSDEVFLIRGAVSPVSEVSTTAEILIGQKRGFIDPLHVQLQFYDADGSASNAYSLLIPAPVLTTAAAVVTVSENMTTAPPPTDKPTVPRTQKETQPTTQRTTQEKTTVEKTTKEKTTKEKTTKEKTTKLRTTKAPRTTKPKTTAAKKAKTTRITLSLVDNDEMLQEILEEQTKTRRSLYIGAGVVVVVLFFLGSYMLKKNDE